jgi:hypothetical protein
MMNLSYRHILIYCCCFLPVTVFAQKVYEGQVVNASTEAPLEKATVLLLKAKIAISTNNQGYYRLVVNESVAYDTLQISYIGYKTYLLPVTKYKPKMFILLIPADNKLNQVDIKGDKTKTVVLDKFNVADIKDLRTELMTKDGIVMGGYFTTPIWTTGILAKLFEAPQTNVKLNTIDIGRRELSIPASPEDLPLATASKYTRFLVHVILPDAVTGKPGKTIFTKEVSLTDNALKITLNLKDQNIIIPTTKFFIAIEWLLIPVNEIVQLNVGNKADKSKAGGGQKLEETARYTLYYQPFMVLYNSDKGAVGWILADNKPWRFMDHRSPHPSRLHPNKNIALSATIVY